MGTIPLKNSDNLRKPTPIDNIMITIELRWIYYYNSQSYHESLLRGRRGRRVFQRYRDRKSRSECEAE
jgi:hypothetical protein